MPFVHGKNVRVLIDGADASGYLKQVQWNNTGDVAETSAFGTSAKTYVPGLTNFTMSLSGMFENTATTGFDAVASAAVGSSTNNNIGIAPNGFARGNVAWAASALVTSYDVQGSVGDMVAATMAAQGSDVVESGLSLKNYTDAALNTTTTETYVDMGAVINSWTAYLFVTSAAPTGGTSPTVTVSITGSNASGGTYTTLTGGTFAGVTTSIGSQRLAGSIASSTTRYVKAVATVTGTPTGGGWQYALVFARIS
mgnify:FL=1